MPPLRIPSPEILNTAELSLGEERIIFQPLEESTSAPSLESSNFVRGVYPLSGEGPPNLSQWKEMKIDPNDLPNGGVQFFDLSQTALVTVKKGALIIARPPLLDRYAWELSAVAGGSFTGALAAGVLYLFGIGFSPIACVVSAITLLNLGFGVLLGNFSRSGGTPGFEIPIDTAGNHYAIGTYPHPWLPIRPPGDLIAYPLSVKRTEPSQVQVAFKIFGWDAPFILTMSEEYARHRKLVPGSKDSKPSRAYYLILGRPRREWLARLQELAEQAKETTLPFRLLARSSPAFAEGVDSKSRRLKIYRVGDEPSAANGKVRMVGSLEVAREGEGVEKLRIHFEVFDPPSSSANSEDYISISLKDGKRMGLVHQDLDGLLRWNTEFTHLFIEKKI
jgi:hypothetical protein